MTIVYPGSFDPVTTGHVDIVRRASKFAKHLIVVVLENPNKSTLFSVEQRILFLKEALANEATSIEIDSYTGLLAEYAIIKKADVILRGLRTSEDFENENKYAVSNSAISESFGNQLETIFIPASRALTFVSSTIIREAAAHIYKNNLNDSFIAELVPPSARLALKSSFM